MEYNKSTQELRDELIDKYGEKTISAAGHLAAALIMFRGALHYIPDGIGADKEEEILLPYLFGQSSLRKERDDINSVQEEFMESCFIEIINISPNLFKESSISDSKHMMASVSALGMVGHSMGDKKINDQLTFANLHDDLTRLYAKKYFDFLRGNSSKAELNPDNRYKEESPTSTSTSDNGGCFGTFLILGIIITALITFTL